MPKPTTSPPTTRKKLPKPRAAAAALPEGGRDWTSAFLAALVETGHQGRAAAAAEIDYATVWRRRKADPEFAQRYHEALQMAAELLEAEAVRRAVHGVRRLKFNTKTGEPYLDPATGEPYVEHDYSDSLLLALLKRYLPEHYRERQEVRQEVKMQHAGSVGVVLTEARHRELLAKKQLAIQRRSAAAI